MRIKIKTLNLICMNSRSIYVLFGVLGVTSLSLVMFFTVEPSVFSYDTEDGGSENETVSTESEVGRTSGDEADDEGGIEEAVEEEVFVPLRLDTPDAVRSVYMTSCYAGTPSLRNAMVDLIERTELNSVVIDIKDYTGMVSFRAEDVDLAEAYATHCPVRDMREFVYDLNQRGIYVIGRITVFQDKNLANKRPDLAVLRESDRAVWLDNKGISFTDPSAEEVWDYHVRLSKESYNLGFDELNFDYIRFPSDGPMRDIHFPHSKERDKADVMEDFFNYLHNELKDIGVVTSADLFGLTTSANDDLGIGQVWEKALPYFDYLSPMVYPSHYMYGFKGLGNPNHHPYEVVKWSMNDAIERTVSATSTIKTIGAERIGTSTPAIYTKEVFDKSVIRPWLQDFRYGGPYTAEDVRLQIDAVYDAGLDSWMLWDPTNRYTPEALRSANYREEDLP